MAGAHRIRDNALIDALESAPSIRFDGSVWRVARAGHDVLMCGSAGGRWDDGTFDVLYTSMLADGAIAEMFFHLSRGQPVIPSKVVYHLFELRIAIDRALRLADLKAVGALGVDVARYGSLSHADRQQEYPRTQDIAETAHFVGFDGLVVPSARLECSNVIVFCDRVKPDAMEIVKDQGRIDWEQWRKKSRS